jgi:hypothetical protein
MKLNLRSTTDDCPGLEVELNSLEELEQFINFVGNDILILTNGTWETGFYNHPHPLTIEVYDDHRE